MFPTTKEVASQLYIPGKRDDDISARVLPKILLKQAERFGSKKFIDICGRSASFEEMLAISNRLAHGFCKLGVKRSDRVAMLLPNCFEFVATWFAVSALGAIEVPSNPELKGELLCHNLNSCGAGVLVADGAALEEIVRIQDKLPAIRTLVLVGIDPKEARTAGIRIDCVIAFDECLAPQLDLISVDVGYSDPMAILYTSGTTGPAKGALMSHHHCYSWAAAMAQNLGYTIDDSYFSALPLFHTDAQMFGVYLPLIYGTQTTLVGRFSASRFWDQARMSGASATNLLGAMAVILMRMTEAANDTDNPFRICQCIPMVPDKAIFERRFDMKLVTGYGQTETSFVAFDTVDETRQGSCGKPHPDWQVAILDGDDMLLPPGRVGEIVSRPNKSWSMFSGYFGADSKTVKTLKNLWYHSGDAGFMDEDGWLYFKHRLNEVIRRRGENISAFEVETIADQHPDIIESVAFGIPSEFTEEDIMLVAMRRDGALIQPSGLLDHFRRCAPRHMLPRYIELIDTPLPRTPTEKIARSALQQRGVTEATFDRGHR
ncbi:AMP-binding protein [Phyllobacterium sp. K27]